MFGIPNQKQHYKKIIERVPHVLFPGAKKLTPMEKVWSVVTFFLGTLSLFFVITMADSPVQKLISPVINSLQRFASSAFSPKEVKESFSFAPGWAYKKFDDVDFADLQTLAYFDIPINMDGTVDQENDGYLNLVSDLGVDLVDRAHANDTKVVLTLTQTSNKFIATFLSDSQAKEQTVIDAVQLVTDTNTDGVVLDFEYTGEGGGQYRESYTRFVTGFVASFKKRLPHAQVHIAISTRPENQSLYDIPELAKNADRVFVIASTVAVPEVKETVTSVPVNGYSEEEYWKDLDASLANVANLIPEDKFVMERAWYGNGENYPFYQSSGPNAADKLSNNTMHTPLSKSTIEGLVAEVPVKARAAARKNVPLLAKALEDEGILNPNVLAYALATIEHETAGTFEPIDEIKGARSARRLGYEGGMNYYGRGFIQLTHARNYKKVGERIGMGDALVKNPELASEPAVAAKILAAFFEDNGVARAATNGRFVAARNPINPDYQGQWIARIAWKFLYVI